MGWAFRGHRKRVDQPEEPALHVTTRSCLCWGSDAARLRSLCTTGRVVDALGGRRVVGKFVRRATWAGNQLPSAVWALATEYIFGARSAERALE